LKSSLSALRYHALYDFNPEELAALPPAKVQTLYRNDRIIRNRQKIDAVIENARVLASLHELGWSFTAACWQNVNGIPQDHDLKEQQSVEAEWFVAELTQTLRHLGFKRVGPKTCYSFLQASGMVNDHLTSCYRHEEISPQVK